MAVLSYLAKRAASGSDKSTTYIVLGIVFGALALVCLLVTVYLLARLRRSDRRLDRELATTIKNADFAPQFYDKDARPLSRDSLLTPPSPAPPRPVRRPSSLFDRRRLSNTPKLPSTPPPPPPPPPHLPPVPSYSLTPPPPARILPPPTLRTEPSTDSLVLPTRPESSMSQYSEYSARTAISEAPTARPGFHRSPSLLRRLLHDRTRGPPPPPVPSVPPQLQHQPLTIVEEPTPTIETGRPERPMITMSVVSELMPYDLETATPGATPVDVPPPSAATSSAPRMPPAPKTQSPVTTERDPHSAARLTLLQPPAPLQPRRTPALTLHIPNPNTVGTTKGTPPPPRPDMPPPPVPLRSPLRKKPAPLMLAPPDNNIDLSATVSPEILAAFAAKLRPETRDFAVLQDENRLTMQ